MGMNEMGNREYWDRLTTLESENGSLSHRLYGNGQPGDIQKIVAQLDSLKKHLEDLEKAYSKLQGAVYMLGVVMPLALMFLQKYVFKF